MTRTELALEVIDRKIVSVVNNNKEKSFDKFKESLSVLENEKKEIIKGNEEVISKVIDVYLKEISENN